MDSDTHTAQDSDAHTAQDSHTACHAVKTAWQGEKNFRAPGAGFPGARKSGRPALEASAEASGTYRFVRAL
jgi:hypothetical protein